MAVGSTLGSAMAMILAKVVGMGTIVGVNLDVAPLATTTILTHQDTSKVDNSISRPAST